MRWPVGQVVKTLPFHGSNMGSNPVRVIFCHIYINIIAGWSSLVARRAHNPKVVGSNPAPAIMVLWSSWLGRLPVTQEITSSSLVRTVFERDLSKCHSFIKRMVFLYCRKVPSEIWKNQVGCLNWQN